MPNAKVLSEKQAIVASLTEKLQGAAAGVIVDYKGITVAEDTELRAECRKNDVEYAVVKNTLLRFAFNNVGLNELDDQLNGTTSLAIAADPVAPARVIADFAKKLNGKFEIKAASWTARSSTWPPSMLWPRSPHCPSCRHRCLAPCWLPFRAWLASSSRSPRRTVLPPRKLPQSNRLHPTQKLKQIS